MHGDPPSPRSRPETPRPPIESRALSYGLDRLLVQLRRCPACDAEHAAFYYPKGHAQDRDDVTFACLACSRCELVVFGIPELSPYKIDLVERLPPELARIARRQHSSPVAGLSAPRHIVTFVIGLIAILVLLALVR